MVDLESLFSLFKREKEYLSYVTPATLRAYDKSWLAFKYHYGCVHVTPTQATVEAVMLSWLESGLAPGAANSYARSVNSFLSWLAEKRALPERFRLPLARRPQKVLRTYSDEDVARILAYAPASRVERRVLALLTLLVDTGCRINEALTLTRANCDFDNLLVTLYGKGRKERRVPISLACRRELFRHLTSHAHALVFCTRDGKRLSYDNIKRDFLAVLKGAGVEKTEASFHAFRRFFAKWYLKKGGNPIYLQFLLGHSTMDMTRRYVAEDAEDLRDAHQKLSPLEGLKRR